MKSVVSRCASVFEIGTWGQTEGWQTLIAKKFPNNSAFNLTLTLSVNSAFYRSSDIRRSDGLHRGEVRGPERESRENHLHTPDMCHRHEPSANDSRFCHRHDHPGEFAGLRPVLTSYSVASRPPQSFRISRSVRLQVKVRILLIPLRGGWGKFLLW